MRVIATAKGYDNVCIRDPGDEFDMPDDTKIEPGCWFKAVERKPEPQPQAKQGKQNKQSNDDLA